MLLTRECDYGIRIIRALSDGQKKTVAAVCKQERIPEPYAYKILKKLERAGYVQSIRGRIGGYVLVMDLKRHTMYDVAYAIDEKMLVFECVANDDFCSFKFGDHPCKVHLEFDRIQERVVKELKAKTLCELVEDQILN